MKCLIELVTLCLLASACTKPNPAVCCISPEDCNSLGIDDSSRLCENGFSCVAHTCEPEQVADAASDVAVGDAPTDAPPQFSSCIGLDATCGSSSSDSCCATAMTVPGGTFYRSYDLATDTNYKDMSYPATVSTFRLDKYEVTVGRFRKFVNAGYGSQMQPPTAGSGAHPNLSGSGWDPTWKNNLASDTASLVGAVKCNSTWQTWTDIAGANENLPINCVTWYEAMAFCAWDGGYLPTEAEWNYAAAGGLEQRSYPWSNPASSLSVDCSYANYKINNPVNTFCVNGTTGATNRVGTESNKGDGRWGHSDLGGNLYEWNLDLYAAQYVTPCTDCAPLGDAANRVARGGSFYYDPVGFLRVAARVSGPPNVRNFNIGVRCARQP